MGEGMCERSCVVGFSDRAGYKHSMIIIPLSTMISSSWLNTGPYSRITNIINRAFSPFLNA